MLSIRLGSFSASTSPSLQPSPDEHYKRSSGFLRCLSPCKKPQTSYKSSSGSWVPFLPTSVSPTSSSLQPSPDERDKRSYGFLRCLSPQTSYKSSSGFWLLLCTTSTLTNAPALPVNPDECSAFVWVPSLSLSLQETPDELWILAPSLHHLDTFPSREPRRMLGIHLGSFSVSTRSFHLSVTATIPRRALIALVCIPSLSLSSQETPDELL